MQRFRFINFILIAFLTFISIFLLVSVPSFAMSTISDYPCYVNQNGNIPADVIAYVDQNYGQSYFVYIGSSIGTGTYGGGTYPFYAFPKNSGSLYANINSDNTFSLVGYNIGYYDAKVGTILKNYQGSWTFSGIQGNYTYWWYQNRVSSMVDSSVDYYTNFDLMSNSDHTQKVISTGTPPLVLPDGDDPTVFDDTGLNLDSSLNPNSVPSTPSGFIYSAPTPPTWDSSQPVQSVWDYIVYGFACLIALIQGVINTISNWIGYIGNLLSYVVQKILNFLKAIVEWLYQQFLAWLTPYLKLLIFISKILFDEDTQQNLFQLLSDFKDDVQTWLDGFWSNSFLSNFWTNFSNYLVNSYSNIINAFSKVIGFFAWFYNHGLDNNNEFSFIVLFNYLFVPEPYQVVNLFYNHDPFHFIQIITDVRSFINTFLSAFDEVDETYVITLDSFTIAGVEMDSIDIDFSWYIPFQSIGDVVISGFLVFGYFMFLFFRLPYYLRGQAGNVSGSVMEAKK